MAILILLRFQDKIITKNKDVSDCVAITWVGREGQKSHSVLSYSFPFLNWERWHVPHLARLGFCGSLSAPRLPEETDRRASPFYPPQWARDQEVELTVTAKDVHPWPWGYHCDWQRNTHWISHWSFLSLSPATHSFLHWSILPFFLII